MLNVTFHFWWLAEYLSSNPWRLQLDSAINLLNFGIILVIKVILDTLPKLVFTLTGIQIPTNFDGVSCLNRKKGCVEYEFVR